MFKIYFYLIYYKKNISLKKIKLKKHFCLLTNLFFKLEVQKRSKKMLNECIRKLIKIKQIKTVFVILTSK